MKESALEEGYFAKVYFLSLFLKGIKVKEGVREEIQYNSLNIPPPHGAFHSSFDPFTTTSPVNTLPLALQLSIKFPL